jgi:hypothetical protein
MHVVTISGYFRVARLMSLVSVATHADVNAHK